jgi:lysophospholipase L1-like esterase
MKKISIHFFGDSICFGQGISLYKGWVPKTAAKLDEDFKNRFDIIVTNNAKNGRTSRQALEDMPYEIQVHFPDIFVFQFGMNDCNYWESDGGLPRVSIEGFKANMTEIVRRAKIFNTKHVMIMTNHPTTQTYERFKNTEITYENSNEAYNKVIREVSAECLDVILVDIEQEICNFLEHNKGLSCSDYLLDDQLHLSEGGHNAYFSIIYPAIHKLVNYF